MIFLLHIAAIYLTTIGRVGAQCPVNIPGSERRDCYPWAGAVQGPCEARGCVWCDDSPGYPSCFYNDAVCPSEIPENLRTDCLPEGGAKPDCLAKSCIWCEPSTPGVPQCFPDPKASQGGSFCPASILDSERIDCYPDSGFTEAGCLKRGCYFCGDKEPACIMPKQHGYRLVGNVTDTPKGFSATLKRVNTPSWYGADVQTIRIDVEYQTAERLRIKISDPNKSRFEVPQPIDSPPSKFPDPLYYVTFDTTSPVFGFRIVRRSTGAVIFDTTIGGLQFSDQFLQIATRLNTRTLYGFGEHEHRTLLHDMNWKTWSMYARDQAVTDSNLYGVHPFYMNVEKIGFAHGILFLNSNAQEVQLTPAPGIVYRTTGGILDIYAFLGPTPDNVVQQYTEAIGRPLMVPYWSLGFQLCRYGYITLYDVNDAVNRMRQYDIPHDAQYGDIDYMYVKMSFTYSPTNYVVLPEYVQELKKQGTRFIIILDPGIYKGAYQGAYPPLDHGNQLGIWVQRPDGTFAVGEVWPGEVYYPDFTNPDTQIWMTRQCVVFIQEVEYGALWIDMNEPSNFVNGDGGSCANNSINFPPFVPEIADKNLFARTLCPDSVQAAGSMYDVHSLYGWSMSKQALSAVRTATGKRSFVFSRSTFPGSGSYAQHWLGDNESTFASLKYSLIGTMEFNMFGYPYVGPDICGHFGNATEQLCQRWHQVGAFYPFSRNHNGAGYTAQDPGIWPEVARVTRETLHIRYTLLPFLYTLMHKAHSEGSTVVRPLFFEFSSDEVTYSIDEQFLWGSALLISPVLTEDTFSVNAYFPDSKWYSYYNGSLAPGRASFVTVNAPLDFIPLHVRGGYILPTQQPANSTMFSRALPMGLIVALNDLSQANGDLFWDDGESIDTFENGAYYFATYSVQGGELSSAIQHNGYSGVDSLFIDDVRVFGIAFTVSQVFVNSAPHSSWSQDGSTGELTIRTLNLPLSSTFTIQWYSGEESNRNYS